MSARQKAVVTRRDLVGADLFRLTLEVPPLIASSYHRPGQYHRLSVDGVSSAFFAMASPPGGTAFEYVVRHQGQVAGQLEALKPGDVVQVSEVEGPGFPVNLLAGHDVVLVGTGTGFGPIRATLESLRPRRAQLGRVIALYGANTTEHLAWREHFDAWAREGLEVWPVLFEPGADWTGRTGWVQHHLELLPLENAFAFLCGHPAMVETVRALLVARGLRTEHIFNSA